MLVEPALFEIIMPAESTRHDLFREQWVRWQPRVYAYIRTMVFRRADAEDVLQEVAAVLWKKIDEFEPGTRFDQWAFRTARYKVLNFQKKKARDRLNFSDELQETIADESALVLQTEGRIDALETCVEKLPPEHRKVLKLRYEPGATSRSVAGQTGRSESAISRTLSRIYQSLLHCMRSAEGKTIGDRT